MALRRALLETAEKNLDVVMRATRTSSTPSRCCSSHHLLAYFWMFSRDFTRLVAARTAADANPLGAAALAGTTYPLDRQRTTELLGFSRTIPNSLDAVSDRDYLLDLEYACAVSMMHLSRLCEEIVLWSSTEFGFITLSDAYSTGSSIMPQKKNPDFAELTRGQVRPRLRRPDGAAHHDEVAAPSPTTRTFRSARRARSMPPARSPTAWRSPPA